MCSASCFPGKPARGDRLAGGVETDQLPRTASLSFYHLLGVRLSLLTVSVSHALIVIPFIMLVLLARLETFEFRIEEASRDLGAGLWQTFRHVTFPLVLPSLVGALLLAAAFSLDEFVVTFVTIGSQNMMPTYIWSQLTNQATPTNAIATLLLGASGPITLLAVRRGSRVGL